MNERILEKSRWKNKNTQYLFELQKFLDIMKDIGVGFISFDIDFNDILMHKGRKFVIPPHYYEMKKLAESFCTQNDMEFVLNEYTKQIMEKGFFE